MKRFESSIWGSLNKSSITMCIVAIMLLMLTSGCCKDEVYCPLTSYTMQYVSLMAYVKLRSDMTPIFVEVRRLDRRWHWLFRRPKVLFRAYGAEDVTLETGLDGFRVSLFAVSGTVVPDTVVVIDYDKDMDYFEFNLKPDSL